MRASRLVISRALSLLGASVLGCGGGSAKPDAFVCSQMGTVNLPTAVDFSRDGQQIPGEVPMMNGGTQLRVAVIVTVEGQPDRGFLILQVNNTGLFSGATGKAGRFEKPPAPGSYPMDPDASIGFGIDFVDGIITNGDGTATLKPNQVALLDMTAGGTVRIDSFTPAAAPDGTTTVAATITNAKFKGYNLVNGAPDPAGNGCDITVQNFQFGMVVKWQAGMFPTALAQPPAPLATSQPVFDPQVVDRAVVVSAGFRLE